MIVGKVALEPAKGFRLVLSALSLLGGEVLIRRSFNLSAVGTGGLIKKMFERLSKELGIKIYAHKLRKTYSTHFMHGGGDIHDLQDLLGHSLITTTQIYIGTDYARLKELHGQHLNYGNEIEIETQKPVVLAWAGRAGWLHCRGC